METDLNSVYTAIITSTSALLGVLIGGLLQYCLSEKQYERKRIQTLNAASLFIAEIIPVLNDFNAEEKMCFAVELNIIMPKFLQSQLDTLYMSVSEYDPRMAINILWTKQACENVDIYLKKARIIWNKNPTDVYFKEIIQMALVDVKSSIKYTHQIVIRHYNKGGKKARTELFDCKSFQEIFAEKSSQKSPVMKFLMKCGLKKLEV